MPEPTPVTRSRLPFIAIAVWAAILAAIVAVGVVFGGRAASTDSTNARLGAAGAPAAAPLNFNAPLNLNAPLAADPSASPNPSAGTGTNTNGDDPDHGPRGFGGPDFGFGGRGPRGFGGPHGGGPDRGHGPITITAINGGNLSLKTDDGWTRTIDATGATITGQGGATLAIGDLKVGDQIAFRQTRNTDGTYRIDAIVRIPPRAAGTVKSVAADSATLTQPDGSSTTIGLTAGTTYTLEGKAATAADLKVGTRVRAVGTKDSNGAFTATHVDIEPAMVVGKVTARTADTITVTDRGGTSVTIHVTSSTTYETRGNSTAGLADVAVGNVVLAQGTLNGDGSLTATDVRIGPFGPGGPGRPHGDRENDGAPANPGGSPDPSANAG